MNTCVRAAIGAALIALAQLAIAPGARAGAPTGGGRWWLTAVPTPGAARAERDVRVWLPPSYDRPESAAVRYPVIVFLHGWPGSEGNWPGQGRAGETLGRLMADKRIPEAIGLFPDGNGAGMLGRSLWMDSHDGRSMLETFLVSRLVPWADRTLRTRADRAHRGLIGLSDGATAAFDLLLRHPGVFGAVGAHSGEYKLEPDLSSAPLFGPAPGADSLRRAWSPLLAPDSAWTAVRGSALYVDCGDDDSSLGDARALQARLARLGVPLHYEEANGGHGWDFWRAQLAKSLVVVTGGMR